MDRSLRLRVVDVTLLERPVRLRLPFRYGKVTLREAPEAFARVRIEAENGAKGSMEGIAAELLAPKWFDKNPDLTDAENMDQLRASLREAAKRCVEAGANSPFDLSIAMREPPFDGLVDGYGPAMLDRAVLDAAARLHGVSFTQAIRSGLAGFDPVRLAPDLAGFDSDAFVQGLTPSQQLDARHTVGIIDPLVDTDLDGSEPDDGLPVTLEQVARAYGNRWYKVKIGGDARDAAARIARVAQVLDGCAPADYRLTVDGNELYRDADHLAELLSELRNDAALAQARTRIHYIEQPLDRAVALRTDVSRLDSPWPLLIDESDASLDAFREAREHGYAGVSSKQCKGVYKSLTNAARCAHWNRDDPDARYFMSAEDLTCQGGICVQQDLAIAALLGVSSAERNGHHFAGPMPGATAAEQRAFLGAHPDLYEPWHDGARLRIHDGRLDIASLQCPGFARKTDPDFKSLATM